MVEQEAPANIDMPENIFAAFTFFKEDFKKSTLFVVKKEIVMWPSTSFLDDSIDR